MPFLRKYNTLLVTGTTAIRIPIIKRAVVDFAVSADWTPAAGDVKVFVDGAAVANITNLPTAIASGNTAQWEFILTAAELSCKQILVMIADAATKAIEDQSFIVETYGNTSAMYAADFSLANLPANVTSWLGTACATPTVGGVPEVDLTHVAGTAQTAGDIIADTNDIQTRLPAALTANGNMKSSIVEILTTALTETAGQISAAFKQFFDVASPTGTMKAITNVVTTTNLTNAPTAGDLTATMKTSIATTVWDEVLTAATHNVSTSAGKRLRQLGAQSIGSGTLPSQAGMAINAITLDATATATSHLYVENLIVIDTGVAIGEAHHILSYNGTTKVAIIDDDWITQPVAGDTYEIYSSSAFDATTGLAQAGGANTITLEAAQSSAVTDYYINQSVYIASGVGAGQRRRINAYNGTTKVATVSSNWATNPDATSAYMIYEGNQVSVDTNNDKAGYSLSQSFPTNFASLSITAGGLVDITQAAADKVWSTAARLLTAGTNIALTKGVGLLGLNDITATDVWAATTRTLSSFGTLVSDIWANGTRTLTGFSTALAVSVWDVLESAITTASSIGLKAKTNLDATISSRLATSGYTAPDNSGISSILTESQSHPTLAEIEATTVLAKEATVTAIKAKTDTIVWTNITDIKDESLGKWSINKSTNVLTIYKADGVTVLKQFNLTDNASVSERVPI